MLSRSYAPDTNRKTRSAGPSDRLDRADERLRIRPVRDADRRLRHRLGARRHYRRCSCPRRASAAALGRLRRRFPGLERPRRRPPSPRRRGGSRPSSAARATISPICRSISRRVGAFERAVYRRGARDPGRRDPTYGALAAGLGDPGQARAVGQALGRNPWPIVIPCHRITARRRPDGRLLGARRADDQAAAARDRRRARGGDPAFVRPRAPLEPRISCIISIIHRSS